MEAANISRVMKFPATQEYHSRAGKIFILIDGTEFVLSRRPKPGWPWIQLPPTILYNIEPDDPVLLVASVTKQGAKIAQVGGRLP